MSRTQTYFSKERGERSSNELIDGDAKAQKNTVDENFLKIVRCLDDAQIYVSTSRRYITASKQTVVDLKNFMIHAEADINTAEDCIAESETRLQSLKSELQTLFSRTFCQNLDSLPEEGAIKNDQNEAQSRVCLFENSSLHGNISRAIQNYAEESDMNQETMFIMLHPKEKATNYPREQTSNWPSDSKFKEKLLNITLDNDLQCKEAEDATFVSGCRNMNPQSIENARISNRIEDTELCPETSRTENPQLFAQMKDSKRNHAKDVIKECRRSKFQTEWATPGVSSPTRLQKVSLRRATMDLEPIVSERLSEMKLCNRRTVHDKSTSTELYVCKNESFSLYPSTHNTRQSENTLSEDPTEAHAAAKSKESSDVSLLRLSQSSDRQYIKQQEKQLTQNEGILIKIHSSDSTENEVETSMDKNERNKVPKHQCPSEKRDFPNEDLIKMSSSDSSENIYLLLQEDVRKNKSDPVSIHPVQNTENSVATSTNVFPSGFTKIPRFPNKNAANFRKTITKCASENNLSRLLACMPKSISQNFKNKNSFQKSETCLIDSPDFVQPESSVRDKRTNFDKPTLRPQSVSKGKETKKRLETKTKNGHYLNRTFENKHGFSSLNTIGPSKLSNKSCSDERISYNSNKLFLTPQPENRRLTSTSANFPGTSYNNAFYVASNKEIQPSHGLYVPRGSSEFKKSNNISCLTSSDEKFVLSDADRSKRQSCCSSWPCEGSTYVSYTEDVFYPKKTVDKTTDYECASDSSVSESTKMSMSHNMDTEDSHSHACPNDEGEVNDDTSDSVQVNVSDVSIMNRSEALANEILSGPSCEFSNLRQLEQFSRATLRHSVESFSSAQKCPMGVLQECFDDKRSLESISEESCSTRRAFPNIPVTECQFRSRILPFISSAKLSSSTPRFKTYESPKPDYSP